MKHTEVGIFLGPETSVLETCARKKKTQSKSLKITRPGAPAFDDLPLNAFLTVSASGATLKNNTKNMVPPISERFRIIDDLISLSALIPAGFGMVSHEYMKWCVLPLVRHPHSADFSSKLRADLSEQAKAAEAKQAAQRSRLEDSRGCTGKPCLKYIFVYTSATFRIASFNGLD